MKELKSFLTLLAVVVIAGVLLAAILAGRTAVHEHYAYQAMLAPRTLHQMVREMEAADEPDRSSTLLFGAGLLALVGLTFGGFVVAMRGGTDLLRERRLGRKRPNRRTALSAPLPAPPAPHAPEVARDREGNENYANSLQDFHR